VVVVIVVVYFDALKVLKINFAFRLGFFLFSLLF
jgi:hypothetical protein